MSENNSNNEVYTIGESFDEENFEDEDLSNLPIHPTGNSPITKGDEDLTTSMVTDNNSLSDSTPTGEIKTIGEDSGSGSKKKQILSKFVNRNYEPPFVIKNEKIAKRVSFGWGILVILISGTLYGFTILSNEIKEKLDYSQTEINEAISIGDVGIYVGVTVGFLYDIFGPFITCIIAGVLYLIGYLGVWGIVSRTISNKNPFLLSFFLFLVGQASHASFTAAIVSNVHNYSLKHRGKITGLLVGMFAISSGVFGMIYKTTFKKHKDAEGYLLFLAITLTSVSLIGTILIRKFPEPKEGDNEENTSDTTKKEGTSILLSIKNTTNNKYELLNDVHEDLDGGAYSGELPTLDQPNYLDGKRDITGFQLFRNLEFWLMLIVYLFNAGGCLMFLNNIGPLVASLGKEESFQSDLVIIFAVSNLSGRIIFGLLSDYLANKISRFWLVVLSNFIISVVHMVFAFTQNNTLIESCILTGIGYGGMVSMMVALTSLRFGSRRYGLNFGLLALSSAIGSFLAGIISGQIYDYNSIDKKCYGEKCYRLSFIISSIVNFISVFVGLFLIYMVRRDLKKLVKNRVKVYW